MKKLFLMAFVAMMGLQLGAQNVSVSKAFFKQGDDMNWAKPEMDDASWSEIDITKQWGQAGLSPKHQGIRLVSHSREYPQECLSGF